jgi:hypothetical protein
MLLQSGTVAVLLSSPAASWATTIFSNFGPSGSLYNATEAQGLGEITIGSNTVDDIEAMQFTIPAGAWTVTQVDLPIKYYTGPADAFVAIFSDNGGVPGSLAWSASVAGIPAEDNACCSVTTVALPYNALVLSSFVSSTYWFVVGPGNVANTDAWQISGVAGREASSTNDFGSWTAVDVSQEAAFDVQGTNLLGSTPEPAAFALVAVGFGALLIVRRRTQTRLQVTRR